jgi:site-specific DNA-adenine methylase
MKRGPRQWVKLTVKGRRGIGLRMRFRLGPMEIRLVSRKHQGGGAASRWSPKLLALRTFARRMDGVIVEHLDWTRMLKNYDSPETLFFLDPPYVGGAQKSYKSWTMEDMEAFYAAVCQLKGRWVVTVGDTPEMRALWKGHRQKRVERSLSLRKSEANVKKQCFGELIVIKATGGASNE